MQEPGRRPVSVAVKGRGGAGLVGLALALLLVFSVGADERTIEGFWSGGIELGAGRTLEIQIDILHTDGVWHATFYAPAQGVHGVELEGIEVSGRSFQFRIPQTRGEPTFRGELSEDGLALTGEFRDEERTMPFRLALASRPEDLDTDLHAEYRQPGVPGEGLAGDWRALLVTGPNRIRLLLEVRSEDGRLSGKLTSLDQNSTAMPVDGFELAGGRVSFSMLAIGAVYEGTMKPDGSEFTGLWRQAGQEFPLTFRRKGAAGSAGP